MCDAQEIGRTLSAGLAVDTPPEVMMECMEGVMNVFAMPEHVSMNKDLNIIKLLQGCVSRLKQLVRSPSSCCIITSNKLRNMPIVLKS